MRAFGIVPTPIPDSATCCCGHLDDATDWLAASADAAVEQSGIASACAIIVS
jgi:hypothetical protein